MHWKNNVLRYSPSDLTVFLDGEFPSWMDRWYAEQRFIASKSAPVPKAKLPTEYAAPHRCVANCSVDADDAERDLIARKGIEHEKAFLAALKQQGMVVVECPNDETAPAETLAAMKNGAQLIYQACLQVENWGGFADFLAKLDGASKLGTYHYEVWDTKLARSAKPYFLVQLCAYAEMLEAVQGTRPKQVEVVLGNGNRLRFTTDKFFYYYRELKKAFTHFQDKIDLNTAPYPGESAAFGRWSNYVEEILLASDDLTCVARMTRLQARRLRSDGINTMTDLASTKKNVVPGMTAEIFTRQKQQASLQVKSRGKDRPLFAVVKPSDFDPRRGLAVLPTGSEGDVFFDMEGYPLAVGGLEYLFGAVYVSGGKLEFTDWWAHNEIEEKLAFEQFIDSVYARWKQDPAMHIYHYASYEVHAMRRLMGKYATRENQVDDLLRNEVFVDLYTIVRQGLIVGTPNYSLKEIEKLYLEKRAGGVTTAGGSVVAYQRWLDAPDGATWQNSKMLREIRDYNQVDCESTAILRDWLVAQQKQTNIPYLPKPLKEAKGKKNDASEDRQRPSTVLANELLKQVADGKVQPKERAEVQELLAWLLEFHWREAKPVFWRMFDRHDMTEQELIDDLDCLGAIHRTSTARTPIKRSWGYDYKFNPDQDTKLHEGSTCYFAHDLSVTCEITAFDPENGIVQIKLGPSTAPPPNTLSLIPNEYVHAEPIPTAILRFAAAWTKGITVPPAVEDILFRRPPRVKGHTGGPLILGSPTVPQIVDIATRLDNSALFIQGPPGTGKTFTAAAIIVHLLSLGKSVGITSNSHKAILNAMHAVIRAAAKNGKKFSLIKVGGESDDPLIMNGQISHTKTDLDPAWVQPGVVVGGTAWLFSREELVDKFDYLVIDEAGQVALANVVATGESAKNLILVGDQMQLAQPIQGSHPGESGKSALDYLLQAKATVPPEFGIFLDVTWRMHPHICSFISNAVYDGRLKAHEDNKKQEILCANPEHAAFKRTCGVAFVEVPHEFNAQSSDEEVDEIEKIVKELLGRRIVDRDSKQRILQIQDILVVAPYNMQVRRLRARLGNDAKVGSVDKFQGQEAPVVIVSMCASAAEDVPRGIEFILNKNRLNVAVSRAMCLAIVVGCRGLMAPRCTTIGQIEMANLYCWLAAHAETSVS